MTDRAALEKAIAVAEKNMADNLVRQRSELQTLIDAARAHLDTLPKTKMVEVWRVEWAQGAFPMLHQHVSKADAETNAKIIASAGHRCIKVTGPHLQEIPQ